MNLEKELEQILEEHLGDKAGHESEAPGPREPVHSANAPHLNLGILKFCLQTRGGGCFSICKKKPSGKNYGSFEATCPFHRKSLISGCKKLIPVQGPTENDAVIAMRRLKWWCAQARGHNMQWSHVFTCDTVCVPDDTALEAMRIDEAPAEVMDDETIFFTGGGQASSAGAASSSG